MGSRRLTVPLVVLTVVLAAVLVAVRSGGDPATRTAATAPPRPQQLTTPDLAGWDHVGGGEVEAGQVAGTVVYRASGGPGALVLDRELADFAVELEFALGPAASDVGLLVRAPAGAPEEGVEVDLAVGTDGMSSSGHIVGLVQPIVFVDTQPGTWHTLRVEVTGDRVFVDLDGRHVSDWADVLTPRRMPARGHLALAHTEGSAQFRAIRLFDLG